MPRLFVFGYGFTGAALGRRLAGKGWTIAATARDPRQRDALTANGVIAVDPADPDAVAEALREARAILVTAPPGPNGCPGLEAVVPQLARTGAFPDWIGYLSTTGVYGDRGGGWVDERSRLAASSTEGARRVAAERDWRQVGRGMGLTVVTFRLPGIYGPGRSTLDRLRAGTARNIQRPGQVFSRIHVEDVAAALEASIARPRAGAIYNLVDDEPSSPDAVIALAAELLGVSAPPVVTVEDEAVSQASRRFFTENKRVSNARAKAELDWRPSYPSYREGLRAVLQAGG